MKIFINVTEDPMVRRLRWLMMGVMLFSIINTLVGQPESFWHNAETAIRGDGLSIHHKTNHTFEFFLGRGWQAYLLSSAAYCAAAFLLVSVLPRTAALIAIFSFIFGHYFGASNWLVVRWHLGMSAPPIYGIVLGAIVTFSAFPMAEDIDRAVKRLRWVVVGAILADLTVTLIGQPGSYWHHPETMHEANAVSRFFLGHGWWAYFLYDLVYAFGVFQLLSKLPRVIALVTVFPFVLGHFNGVSCWFFYEWRMGMKMPVIIGMFISAVIVLLAFRRKDRLKTPCSFSTNDSGRLSFLGKLCS